MAYMNRPSPPLSPDSKAPRISIDALLNPSGGDRSQAPPSPPLQDSYYYQRQQYYPQHGYQQSHYHSIPYRTNGHSAVDEHTRSERRRGSDSVNSSPGPYGRERFPSVSSGSSAPNDHRRRPPRPKYDEEEMYFIWYHRVDLDQEWKLVRESFNAQFPNRQRSGFQGIQCKFYRFIKEKKCPTLREQRRRKNTGISSTSSSSDARASPNDSRPAFGVISWTGVRYPWMREYGHGEQMET
ncbi:hypothetical protein AJ80_01478 [Polytolypa hystricis UAMH7299]|uniref:Uncharacterized protein n=1 Tax=Polytolypa hystricis (strain UAMH7299) TaxID=1447883 RepID=A0A2B7YYZ3_POLH7|nr:hypothetical protein AJ80_01478 [Polytolypa hystricis UAMH7299]